MNEPITSYEDCRDCLKKNLLEIGRSYFGDYNGKFVASDDLPIRGTGIVIGGEIWNAVAYIWVLHGSVIFYIKANNASESCISMVRI